MLAALIVEHPPGNTLYPPETQTRMFTAEPIHVFPSPEKPV